MQPFFLTAFVVSTSLLAWESASVVAFTESTHSVRGFARGGDVEFLHLLQESVFSEHGQRGEAAGRHGDGGEDHVPGIVGGACRPGPGGTAGGAESTQREDRQRDDRLAAVACRAVPRERHLGNVELFVHRTHAKLRDVVEHVERPPVGGDHDAAGR